MHITVVIEGINLEKLLRAAQEEGVVLRAAQRISLRSMRVCVCQSDIERLRLLCEKSGWQMRETGASLPVRAARFLRRRCMFIPAMLLCMALVGVSSKMILRVRVEHAQENGAQVRRLLEETGVRPGRMKDSVSLDALRAQLAYRLPGLSFVGARYAGSTLIIDCRAAVQGEQLDVAGSERDIVAARPGIITHIWASSGTPQVVPGQAVRRGQVLIRGEERTQGGEMRPVTAQGQVSARVFASGRAQASLAQTRVVETGVTRTRVTVRTPWHARVVREAEPFESQIESRERQAVVGLYLPLWREIETYAQTEVFSSPRTTSDAASIAQGAAEEIAKKECPYGALIIDKTVDYSMIDNEFVCATVVLEFETSIAGRIR